ncbi:MAG: tripartite tricarboxylate transporter TctB family protein, partial [Burkholderiales bacterium]
AAGREPAQTRAWRVPLIPASRFRRVGEAALLIALYVALLRPLGFMVTTFVCMSALYLIADERGFGLRPFGSGAVLTAVTYVLFKSLLEVPLPAGTLWD